MMNPDVQPEHFPIWLGLFETIARHVLTPTKADNIMALAHRIGAGLKFGLQNYRVDSMKPPFLG